MTPTISTIHRPALAALLVAAGLLATACGGGSTSHSTTSTQHGATTSTAPPASGTTGTTGTAGTTTTTSTTTAAAPVQTAVWTPPLHRPQQMRVSIYNLRRDSPYLVLDFGLTCLTRGGCATQGLLMTNAYEMTSSAAYAHQGESASGIVLVDPAAAQVYGVATDHDGDAFTSAFDADPQPAGRTYLGWARYRLPPASVTSLDVGFPAGGPVFTGVPITTSSQSPNVQDAVAAAAPSGLSLSPTSTTGMTLPVRRLTLTSGSDSRYTVNTATRSSIALRGDVLFHFDKSTLTPRARGTLRSVAAQIKSRARGKIQVDGYTDDIGTQAFNLGLSRRRAASVVAALRRMTPGVSYSAAGHGESDPVANNKTPSGRALNRRVTVSFSVKRRVPARATRSAPTSMHTSGTLQFRAISNLAYRLGIASARRDGQLLLVQLTVTCIGPSTCQPGGDLGAGTNTIPPEPYWERLLRGHSDFIYGGAPTYDSVNGFTLLDPATGEAYLAARAGLVPLTGTFYAGGQPRVGRPTTIWAYYPAPPASVTRLALVAPRPTGYWTESASGRPEVQLGGG